MIEEIVEILKKGKKFLLLTHKDPDLDGIGSMMGLAYSLKSQGKEVVCFTETPLRPPLSNIKGAKEIVHELKERDFDATIALDCSDIERTGSIKDEILRYRPIINIDHHETNNYFGDINFVVPKSSSTGELVFNIIKKAGFPVNQTIAENIFAAIQADTGCFKYENTTVSSFRIAAELMEYGVSPWYVYTNMSEQYTLADLKLLELALATVELHCNGKLSIMSITYEMIEKAGTYPGDSERFITYPRFIAGVEIAALIRQIGIGRYKFSLRSNGKINVAKLAKCFGGGGHARAAGFECEGELQALKERFIRTVSGFFKE